MSSRQRVLNTLEFKGVDRLATDVWVLPAAKMHYKEQLEGLKIEEKVDIISLSAPLDLAHTPEFYELGTFVDAWGCTWRNIQAGIIGEVKVPVFEEYDEIDSYQSPLPLFCELWDVEEMEIINKIREARKKDKFIIGGWISIFEKMQYLRGTENLYCDIALDEEEMYKLADIVMEYYREYIKRWKELDIDAITFGDDWGSQISLLISPNKWREFFKPLYVELIQEVKKSGKKVFFHSDGYIFDIYQDLIDMGVDAINSQLWCMGVEKVAEQFAGKITFWGEISRQTTLPSGTPEEIKECAMIMKEHLFVNGGGLIGQSEINRDVPLENIEALLESWN